MIDWTKAPEGATHAVLHDGGLVSWARIEPGGADRVYCELAAKWISVAITGASVLRDYDLIARPAPRTEADDLLDMIREQKRLAFEMGYREGYVDCMNGKSCEAKSASGLYFGEQEKQS